MNRLTTLTLRALAVFTLIWATLSLPMHAVSWFPLGPYGGDARSFAADPHDSKHLYLGTANGWIYDSHDGGENWVRLSQIDKRNDLILDHILPDARKPMRLLVGAWTAGRPDGGLFLSEDGGHTWSDIAEMRGQYVLSVARAPSDPDMIVAGTLKGVFRSTDNGEHWSQISPIGSTEIHEIESLAIDPLRSRTMIYAGTWHLPWKTVDGGAHWTNIKQGIIEDSDVFSILIDPTKSRACRLRQRMLRHLQERETRVLSSREASASRRCRAFPSAARRTRKLAMDPSHLADGVCRHNGRPLPHVGRWPRPGTA